MKLVDLYAKLVEVKAEAEGLEKASDINAKISEIEDIKAQIKLAEMADADKKAEIANKIEKGDMVNINEKLDNEGGLKNMKKVNDVRATAEYSDMFYNAIRTNSLKEIKNVISVGSGNTIPVPVSFQNKLIEKLKDMNIMRQLGTVIKSDSDKEYPIEASIGGAEWTEENASYHESDDTFTSITLKAFKLTKVVKVSEEALEDNTFGLEDYIVRNLAFSMGVKEEEAMIVGDGTGKPTGVMVGASAGVTCASATAITADEVIDLFYSLKRAYRKNAKWLMNDSTVKAIRKLKDERGNYLWTAGLNGTPDTILGRAIEVSDFVEEIATGKDVIAFGDFSFYTIQTRGSVTLQRLNELYSANGQVGFKGKQRMDAKLTISEAVKKMKMA